MDTTVKREQEKLDFPSFIKQYFNWYEVDSYNQEIIKKNSRRV